MPAPRLKNLNLNSHLGVDLMKYIGAQKILVGAVALALCGSAAAQVDLKDAATTLLYASEIKLDDTASAYFSSPGDTTFIKDMDFETTLGTSLLSGKDYFIRFELSAGNWVPATVSGAFDAQFDNSGTVTAATVAPYISPNGDNAFIIGLTPGGTIPGTAKVQISVNSTAGPLNIVDSLGDFANITAGSQVKINFTIHETQSSANGADSAILATGSGTYFKTSGNIVSLTQTGTTLPLIDVADQSLTFEGGLATAPLCTSLTMNENDVAIPDGTLASASTTVIDGAAAGSQLVVTGNFDAAGDNGAFDTATALGRVYLKAGTCTEGGTATTDAGVAASTLSATEATFVLNTAPLGGTDGTLMSLCYTTNGSTTIPVSDYIATYSPVSATGYSMPENEVTCNELSKGGSSAVVPLVLSATSAWQNLMRVSNPSNIGGNIHMYVYNDSGVKYGPWSFWLNAGESTGLITVPLIVNNTGAATAEASGATPSVGVGKLNKLRLLVEAEFGDNDDETTKVQVRSYVLPDSTSGTFTQFQ
jgi:hypothetical protein